MPRKAKPFYWEERGGWYYFQRDENNKRHRVRLADTEKEAYDEWHRLESQPAGIDSTSPTVELVATQFALWLANNRKRATCDYYAAYLHPLAKVWAQRRVDSIKPFDLTQYLAGAKLPKGAQRAVIVCVKACFNWGVKQGVIDKNPLASVQKPAVGRREETVDEADRQRVLAKTDAPFRLVVQALTHTGCRPQEVRKVEASNFVEGAGVWLFVEHKTGEKTGKPRVVHLSPCLIALSRILAKHRTKGPLFLNRQGNQWTCNAIRCRMRRLRESLGLPPGTVAYSFRHTFATNALLNGVDAAELAVLLGHNNLSMIADHYGHLSKHADRLKEALGRALSPRKPRLNNPSDGQE